MANCQACGAEIFFVKSEHSERRIPLDAKPRPDGNVVLLPGSRARYLRKDAPPAENGSKRYVSHFATCPEAAKFRKR